MLVTAYLDGVNLVCLCSVANGRGRVWRWWWWVALTRYHVVRNWYRVIRWELNSSCASERGFVWAGPVVVFAVAIDGGLNGVLTRCCLNLSRYSLVLPRLVTLTSCPFFSLFSSVGLAISLALVELWVPV